MLLAGILLCLTLTALAGPRTSHAPQPPPSAATSAKVPALGDEVPAAMLKRASAARPCDVGDHQTDPCTVLSIGRERITVAWDSASHRVTYLYSTTLVTDEDIRVGDLLGIEADSPITPFPVPGAPRRFVTSDWCDTAASISGTADWCAVMLPVRPKSGRVVGFVQSLYLSMPLWDVQSLQHASWQRSRRGKLQ
jgi:hypothetical protein